MADATGTVETLAAASPIPTLATRNIDVHVAGSVTGQLAIGDNIVQVDAKPGAVVNLYQGKPIVPQPRQTPILLRPRPFRDLLGREVELSVARNALATGQPLEYFAAPGWGKTTLLREVGQMAADRCPDGVVYQPVAGQPIEDLLQFCFDAFYQTEARAEFKPTTGQLRQSLQPLRVLLILDDLELDREHVDALLDWLPNSVVLFAARVRTLWGSGQALGVAGLARDPARQLFERETGRSLAPSEQPAFDELWSSLQGNPLSLLQAAAAVRERDQSIAALVAGDRAAPPGDRIIGQLLSTLSADERKILGALTALYDAAVPPAHLGAIAGVATSSAILSELTRKGLTELKDGGYRLSNKQTGVLLTDLAPQAVADRSIEHFAAWADRFAGDLRLILEVADLLLKVVELATDARRWSDVLRLVHAMQRSLALSGRWGAWQRLLDSGLQAARAIPDRAAEAWILHQLGTRALCLGETAVAGTLLQQALEIRQAIGDQEAVAVTRHNLERLAVSPPPPPPPHPPPTPRLRRWLLRIGISFGAAVTAGFLLPIPGSGSFLGQALFPSGILSLEESQPLSFDGVPVGLTSTPETLTIHNTGRGSLRLTGVSTDPPFQLKNGCPVQLKPGERCSVAVTFSPSTPGHASGLLTVTAGGSSATAALSGSGVFTWRLDPLPIEFGKATVGLPQQKELRLTNTSGAPLPLSSIRLKGLTKSYSVASGRCLVLSIPVGSSCFIAVRFVPGLPTMLTDTLVIADTAGDQKSYPVSGQGVLPQVALSTRLIDWTKDPNTPNPAPIVVTNTGEGILTVSSAMLTQDSSPVFTVDSDGCSNQQLMPQAQCTIEVRHAVLGLRALANDFNGTLQITDNASDSPQSVRLHMVG